MLALAFAACGSRRQLERLLLAAGASTSSSSAPSAGVATAQERLKPFEAAPTEITIKEPLKGDAAHRQDPRDARDERPEQPEAPEVAEEPRRARRSGTTTVVSYDPANPATFNAAIDTALTKKANYIAEAGIPLTPAMIKKVQDAGAKWVLTSVHPVDVKDPVIVDANAYANDALMGKVLADFFVSDSKGKGNIVIEHVPAYPILGGFTDGFQAEVKELCPDCKVKIQNITIPDLVAGKVPSVMVSALRSNPDANYVGFDVGPFAAGIDAALAAAGLSGKVKVIGEAADEAAHRGPEDGQADGVDRVRSRLLDLRDDGRDVPRLARHADRPEAVRPADDADPDQGQRRRHHRPGASPRTRSTSSRSSGASQ